MLKYKIDVLPALKEKGYSTARLRKEKIMGENAIQSLRERRPISWANIDKLCELLHCQPGDIMEYTEDQEEGQP